MSSEDQVDGLTSKMDVDESSFLVECDPSLPAGAMQAILPSGSRKDVTAESLLTLPPGCRIVVSEDAYKRLSAHSDTLAIH